MPTTLVSHKDYEVNNMSAKKIIFIDIDGTRIDYEQKIPESAIKAIKRFGVYRNNEMVWQL